MKTKIILILLFGLFISNCSIVQYELFNNNRINVIPSVVKILIESEKLLNNKGQATGFFCISNKTILTANHILPKSNNFNLKVIYNSKIFNAKVLHQNEKLDLAILEMITKDVSKLPKPLALKKSTVNITQQVFVVGYPFNEYVTDNKATVNSGIISTIKRKLIINGKEQGPFYQADFFASDGFSGSPVFDSMGKVIGMVNYIFSKENGVWQGASYITPSTKIYSYLEKILKQNENTEKKE